MSRDDEEYEEPEVIYIVDEAHSGELPRAFSRDELTMLFLDMKSEEGQAILEQQREVMRARTWEILRGSRKSWGEDD